MTDKKELRKLAKEIRSTLDMDKLSVLMVENILKLEAYQKAKNIMIFYPLKNEVNLLGLIPRSEDKQFYLPKVEGDNLLVCPYNPLDKLTVSAFKTKEPATEPVNSEVLDIVFVPALMVDKNKNRLGYGGGFYDRFLSKYALNAIKIVAISCALIIKELPRDDFDESIDIIVCEDIVIN